jgi:hypothetical protein
MRDNRIRVPPVASPWQHLHWWPECLFGHLVTGSGRRAMETGGANLSMLVQRGRILLSILLDTAMLAIWLYMLSFFDALTGRIQKNGDIEWLAAKWMLGGATLALIGIFIFWDLRAANRAFRESYERRNHVRIRPEPFPSGGPHDSSA